MSDVDVSVALTLGQYVLNRSRPRISTVVWLNCSFEHVDGHDPSLFFWKIIYLHHNTCETKVELSNNIYK